MPLDGRYSIHRMMESSLFDNREILIVPRCNVLERAYRESGGWHIRTKIFCLGFRGALESLVRVVLNKSKLGIIFPLGSKETPRYLMESEIVRAGMV